MTYLCIIIKKNKDMKVHFFLHHSSNLDISEDIRVFKTRESFDSCIALLRVNPLFDNVEYKIIG